MGKGRRNRDKRGEEAPAFITLRVRATKLEKLVRLLSTLCILVTVLVLLMPSWSMAIINGNLAADIYTADEEASLSRLLPLGVTALVLTAVGVLFSAICMRKIRMPLSLVGIGVALVADVMMVIVAVRFASLFPHDVITGRGLNFWDLVLRYYAVLLPTVMLVPTAVLGFNAAKKRDIADTMASALDTTPTLTLSDNQENTSIQSGQ